MRKNTIRLFVLGLIFGSSASIYAQSREQLRINDSLSKVYTKEFQIRKAEALNVAKEKGWPVIIEKGNSFSELMWIDEETGAPIYYKTSNAGSASTARVDMLYPGGELGLNLTGAGMLGGVWDMQHPSLNHVTFGGRVMPQDTFGEASFHSTHVAGTIIGAGSAGHPEARGMAYEANLWANDWNNDIGEMTSQSNALVASNHSYGLDTSQSNFPVAYFGAYMPKTAQVDEVAFNNPKYQPVIAAGNDGDSGFNPTKNGNDLLNSMGTAKNVITVAAVQEVDYDLAGPTGVTIAGFSSFGPTDDFRIKPDIAAKGVNVVSSSNSGLAAFAPSNGTSMAAPAVTGAIILLQQHFSNINGVYMNSATVRALLAHSADEIGPNDGPDHKTGWGLLNAGRAAEIISGEGIIQELTLSQGDTYTYTVESNGQPFKATIAWTDRPGTGSTTLDSNNPELVNDLDLVVSDVNSNFQYPWMLTHDWNNPAAVKGNNDVDNIEQVEFDGAEGEYTITVYHEGNLTGGSQNFSLIISGVDTPMGVDDLSTEDMFNVWPNPAYDQINIRVKSGLGEDTLVSVYDIQGRKVAEKTLSSDVEVLNVDTLSAGMYIVQVTQGAKKEVKKIIIK